ncbi:hypothetical protein PF010_g13280 [Phytophthora fragariae]|uniref:DUF7869 domain-containing protein n=3 Tax=Phytophthora fragariae TaxID=53985 RepID=A0A6G0L0V3_9STRA|nr:hypothetical protein PF003_g32424 [Phytophthora fragariae]KAE9104727.1 hypothetical protein PF010_g13280 [Phytophthora fragariae]
MDFSQNLTLPSVTSTPSQWYFLSLVNVRMFGIYYANKEIQYNYVYDESTAGKGTDEVNSMLHHFIKKIVLPNGHRQLTIYADNCGGQNKNNYVLKMLLAVAQMGDLERVELKFFENGTSMLTPRRIQDFLERYNIVYRRHKGWKQVILEMQMQIDKDVAKHMGELKRQFEDGTLIPDEQYNMGESHFVIDLDDGKTLDFVGAQSVKYRSIVSGTLLNNIVSVICD